MNKIETPHSEQSIYFDAPVANFSSYDDMNYPSSQDIHPQPQAPLTLTPYQLHDDGPVAPQPKRASLVTPPVPGAYETPKPKVAEHPNGSEGWLPTEEAAHPPMPEPQHYQAEPHPQPSHSDLQTVPKTPSRKASPIKREASVSPANGDLHRQDTTATAGGYGGASLGRSSSRRSAHTTSDGRVLPGSAFVNGAGTTGPFTTAPEEEELYARGSEAHANLTPKQKSKIAKEEAKHGKRLTKIIKAEAKTEKQALALAIDELEELQKFQKSAVKNEGRAQANHNKLLGQFKKTEAAYLSAKMKYDTDLAHLKSEEEVLETLKNNSREATEHMQDKAVEVNALRETLRVDEREREVKLAQLKGKSPKRTLSMRTPAHN